MGEAERKKVYRMKSREDSKKGCMKGRRDAGRKREKEEETVRRTKKGWVDRDKGTNIS